MNYYVVSPNAWNDGNVGGYLNYMRRRHVVFMGWGTDNKFGRIFANMQIGDRVIVARGANWQKKSFFVGVVDSPPREDRESGYNFTQYCELRSLVELEEDELPFTTSCTCGASRNPRAIYRLHFNNPADAKIIRRVEKLLKPNSFSYTLREIANWSINKHIAIPALQRGLVWSPLQVEMLWDSILRGFPVGSFVVTDAVGNQSQVTENASTETSYFLLDGQQRYNAIALAFQEVSVDSKAVLWIDLLPPTCSNSSRKFWFKVTTSSHPWGFGNDDSCSLLGWQKYRNALTSFGYNAEKIKLSEVSLTNTWPFESKCPVRMAEIMKAFRDATIKELEEKKTFVDNIKGILKQQFDQYFSGYAENQQVESNICNLYDCLEKLQDYRITANVLKNQTIEGEDDDVTNGVTNLEHLFTRLNTLGTKISPYDLRYSAIKAYWGSIKETNDEIAATIMPAAYLAVIVFRMAMTIEKIDEDSSSFPQLANIPSVLQIRNLGKDRGCSTSRIVTDLYNNRGEKLKRIISDVEKTLRVSRSNNLDGLPPVLRTNIIYDSQDIYLLLAVLAYKRIVVDDMWGVLLWVHWFSIYSKKEICDFILVQLLRNSDTSAYDIMKSLSEKKWIEQPISGDEFRFLLPDVLDLTWRFNDFRNDPQKFPWIRLCDKLFWNRQVMIFAERRYFNETFDYDPAQTNFNSGHNKPWDVDHIVPQAWMRCQGTKFGDWKNFCTEWLWTIGNLAAIPFSVNRSKNDGAEWETYCEHAKDFMFDSSICVLRKENLTQCPEKARLFATACLNRIIRFYNDLLKIIPYKM